jgi:phosphoglucosamine mutase
VLQFGTDGVRGDANVDLTTPLVVALARAVARVLRPERVLVGRDTRESGPRIESDLALGFAIEGVVMVQLGVLPTPAIAFAAAQQSVPAAIVSASHNPWSDNGVKIVGADGRKLPDDVEAAIEAELRALVDETDVDFTGFVSVEALAMADAYIDHLLRAIGEPLGALDVVLDCANGAGSIVAPRAFREAGAKVRVLHAEPDGHNINAACGSTHPDALQRAVSERGATLGLALDGDADRVLAVDEHGTLVDGDQLMTMLALDLHDRGALRNDAIAVTVMTNMGLRRALAPSGINVVETPVGDRNVVIAMQEQGLALGGEQSGHLVFSDHATTGDGLLTGLFVCDLVRRSGRSLSELAAQMRRYPQVLTSVRFDRRVDLDTMPEIEAATTAVERELGDRGRVLVRSSGTEPVVRIMVEAESQSVAEAATERLRSVVEAAKSGAEHP